MSDQNEQTGISAVLPLVENTEHKTQLKKCKFHANCRNATDPEHMKLFICQYLRPCKYGLKCEKLEDEKHKLYFTHSETPEVCKFGDKCKKVTDAEHSSRFSHTSSVKESSQKLKVKKSQAKPKKDADVQYVSAKFSLNGVAVDGMTHN